MRIGESTWARLPAHLQALFHRLPNHGSDEVIAAFPDTESGAIEPHHKRSVETTTEVYGKYGKPSIVSHGDSGSAARFFYTAKADSDDRLGSKHPTVKPVDLMQWLCRLVTPKGGTVLDPFAGTGTTGEAAFREGMLAVLVEREEEYQNDIRRRMALALSGPDERKRESIKARVGDIPFEPGSLFAGIEAAE
jgi:site-specific DNA-methyltransferase (adenine-specific)